MNPYLLVLGLGLVALLQTALFSALPVGHVTPDLMLVLVAGWAVVADTRSAALWALLGGLWLDLLSGIPFGTYTLGLLAVAYIAGLGGGTLYRKNLLLALVMMAIGILVRTIIHQLVLWVLGNTLPPVATLMQLVLVEIGYDGSIMLVAFPLLVWLQRLTGRERLPLE